MPLVLEGACHCRAVKFTLETNTPVPYQICQCSICRKTGGYMGSSNIMGNTKTLKFIRGEDKLKEYAAILSFDADDKPIDTATSKRSFCSNCSTMLWNYHPEWPNWIYPYASCIDTDLPSQSSGVEFFVILRDSCPSYVPVPKGFQVYEGYGPAASGSIESWHKDNGFWID